MRTYLISINTQIFHILHARLNRPFVLILILEVSQVMNTRRSFLCALGTGVIYLPLSTLTRRGQGAADEMPKLDPEDTTAKALEYVHESPDPEKLCKNCQLYTGEADAEWGPCAIFPGKLVNAEGWCKSWIVKAG